MRDYVFEKHVAIDKKEPHIRIDRRLKGLFPDGAQSFVSPIGRKWPHLQGTHRADKIEIGLGADKKILVQAFDRYGINVQNEKGDVRISIDLNLEKLAAARTAIQRALMQFGAFPTAHTNTVKALRVEV